MWPHATAMLELRPQGIARDRTTCPIDARGSESGPPAARINHPVTKP